MARGFFDIYAEFESEIQRLRAENEALQKILSEITAEYEADIEHKYAGLIKVPHERECTRRDYECDMEIVERAKQAVKGLHYEVTK